MPSPVPSFLDENGSQRPSKMDPKLKKNEEKSDQEFEVVFLSIWCGILKDFWCQNGSKLGGELDEK